MPQSEIQIQSELFKHMWNNYPDTRDCFYHVANEAKRTVIEWGQLKASGFRKGIQDIHLIKDGRIYPVELKSEYGEIQPHQKAIHCAWARQGVMTYIFYNSQDAIAYFDTLMTGGDLSQLDKFISPYSKRPDMYALFAKEAKQSECNHKGSPCIKCGWIKGSSFTKLSFAS